MACLPAGHPPCGPEHLLLTPGSSESYAFLFKLLADAGDEVLVPRPSYPLFEHLASLESVCAVQYPLLFDGRWSPDTEAIARAISPRTRAVVVVNPNNPTGSFVREEEAREIARLCAGRGLPVISDEVFAGFDLESGTGVSFGGGEEVLTFRLGGLSKMTGMPQMKLGWIAVTGPPRRVSEAIERLEWIADAFLSVGTPVQVAAPSLLGSSETIRGKILERLRTNLSALDTLLPHDSPCRRLPVEGGWYVILKMPRTRSEEEWALLLLESDGVIVQPGYFYDFESEAWLVLSLLTPPGTFAEGVRRLSERVRAV